LEQERYVQRESLFLTARIFERNSVKTIHTDAANLEENYTDAIYIA